ncbi:MAG: serine/threonine protein kinase [Pirellulales bacterium]
MNLDDHIMDLLIQWENSQRSENPISVQQLAKGDAKLEQQLETLIPSMTVTDWVHTQPNPNQKGLDLPSQEILKQSLIMPNDLTGERFLSNLKKAELCDPQELQQFLQQQSTANVYQLVNALVEAELLTPFQARAVAHGKIKGLTLGKYLILDKIGEGGMGAVYQAKHSRLDRIVALKVLPRESKKNQAVIARFLQEAQTAAKLSHPNIVATHDSDEAHGYQFLVMEYIDGKDLSVSIKRNGALSVAKAVNYLIQAARGLEYAHSQGIIHRDIKPHNLLADSKEVVKILDMGLARFEDRSENRDDLTQEGAIMGTVDYMPPEQAIDTKSVDRRADLYSLGCTLHYFLTGKPPFEGDSLLVKMLAHREQAPPDLTQVRKDVHPQLNFVFQKLMAKLPAINRPAS